MTRRASILVNSYNYEAFVADAIDSALAQAWPSLEVVVVDDGSTDGSRSVIERYGDRIVPVFKENGGQASAFNAGFAAATGDVLLLLDADDWFLPGKVATVMAAFDADPTIGWVFHRLEHRGGELAATSGGVGRVDARDALRAGRPHGAMAPATTGLCFDRRVLSQILPMPERFRITADNFLKAAALALSPGLVLDDVLAVQRIHGANAYTGASVDLRRAIIELDLAVELRQRWPELRRYALRRGLGGLKQLHAIGERDDAADRFVRGCTPGERARVALSQLRWRLA